MLRYRVVLIDTEVSYRRPIQAYFNTTEQIDDWARKVLSATKGPKSWVTIYESEEREIGRINRTDLPLRTVREMQDDDALPIQGFPPPTEKTGE